MIAVTRLSGGEMVVNADLIVSIELTPDTVITLINGDKLIVRETPDEVVERAVEYRRRIAAPVAPAHAPAVPGGDVDGV